MLFRSAIAGGSRPSAQSVRNAINSCVPGDISQALSLNNGAINSGSQALADAVSASADVWNTAEWGPIPAQAPRSGVTHYGRVLTSLIYVFNDPTNCVATSYNGTGLDLVGFAEVNVYDVVTSGPLANRQIRMRSTCDTIEGVGGGGFFGLKVPPSIVR